MIGQTLNHYQVLREIGRGAMGQVFLARDLRLDRPVALKLLPPALVTDEKRVLGTLPYMSPEQLEGRAVDSRSDIFALGGHELQVLRREMELGTALPSSATPAFSPPSAWQSPPTLPTLPVPAMAPAASGGGTAWLRHPLLAAALVAAVTAGMIGGGRLWRDPIDAPTTAALPKPVGGTILPAVARPATGSIAVLPLRNMSGDPAQELFSDGTTEAMIANHEAIKAIEMARYAEVDTELREAVRLGQSNPLALSTLARNEALAGRPESARRMVADLEKAAGSAWVPPTALAHPLFALGEVDRGFAWLQKAVDEKDQTLLIFNVSPYYAPYRADPRYQHILRQLGLDRS